MDLKRLQNNYPGTVIKKQPFIADDGAMYFSEDPYYIAVPVKGLSDGERFMLDALFQREEPPQMSKNAGVWYERLIAGNAIDPDPATHVRLIHFRVDNTLGKMEMSEWRMAIESFFDESTAFIYLSSTRGLIIEQGRMLEDDMVRAIADMLENDFSVKTHFLIGLRYSVTPLLQKAYQEEDELFRLDRVRAKTVASVESDFLALLVPHLQARPILSEIRSLLADDKDWIKIIRALWANQGNVSLTAKKLYMHRNTLQYRMDKFFEATGVCLRRMDGLTIAFLCSL